MLSCTYAGRNFFCTLTKVRAEKLSDWLVLTTCINVRSRVRWSRHQHTFYWQKNIELNKTFNFGVVNKCVILRSYTHAWGRSGTRCRANFREVWTRSSRQLQSSTILLRIPRLFKMLVPSLYPLTIWNTGYQSPDHLPLGNRKNRQSRRPKMPKTRSSDQAGEEPQLDLALINERFVQSESSTQELRDRMNKYDNKLDEMMKMLRKALSDKQP